MVERWHWSLWEIDQTHIESLIPFVLGAGRSAKKEKSKPAARGGKRRVCADQVSWL